MTSEGLVMAEAGRGHVPKCVTCMSVYIFVVALDVVIREVMCLEQFLLMTDTDKGLYVPYDRKYWQSKYLAISPPSRKDKCWRNLNLAVKVVSYDVIMKTRTSLIQHNIFPWRNKDPLCHHCTSE